MPLNERQEAIIASYEKELADVESPRTIRICLSDGIPSSVSDLETDLWVAHDADMITTEQFEKTLGLCTELHNLSDPSAVIAELEYESAPDGSTWLVLREDEDQDG